MTFSLQNSKKSARALLPNPSKTLCFFNIPVKWAFVGTICAYCDLVQQRLRACQGGHYPLQKKMRDARARPPRAHVEILPKPLVSQGFQDRIFLNHMKTFEFLISKF